MPPQPLRTAAPAVTAAASLGAVREPALPVGNRHSAVVILSPAPHRPLSRLGHGVLVLSARYLPHPEPHRLPAECARGGRSVDGTAGTSSSNEGREVAQRIGGGTRYIAVPRLTSLKAVCEQPARRRAVFGAASPGATPAWQRLRPSGSRRRPGISGDSQCRSREEEGGRELRACWQPARHSALCRCRPAGPAASPAGSAGRERSGAGKAWLPPGWLTTVNRWRGQRSTTWIRTRETQLRCRVNYSQRCPVHRGGVKPLQKSLQNANLRLASSVKTPGDGEISVRSSGSGFAGDKTRGGSAAGAGSSAATVRVPGAEAGARRGQRDQGVPARRALARLFCRSRSAQIRHPSARGGCRGLVPAAGEMCPLRGSSPVLSKSVYFGGSPALR